MARETEEPKQEGAKPAPVHNQAQTTGPTALKNGQATDKHHHHDHHHMDVHHYMMPHGRAFIVWMSIMLAGVTVLFLILGTSIFFSPGLKPGDLADRDLIASKGVAVIDQTATSSLKEDRKSTRLNSSH